MKNILIIAVLAILSFACETPTIIKSDLPIEIVQLKEANKYDTILSIESTDSYYLFNKKEYIGKMYKDDNSSFFILGGILLGIIIMAILIRIFLLFK